MQLLIPFTYLLHSVKFNSTRFYTLAILIVSLLSCKKDPAPTPAPAVSPVDSGTYDPTSYYPLKYGMQWVFEDLNGNERTLNCGPHIVDSVFYHSNYYLVDTGHRVEKLSGTSRFEQAGGIELFSYICTKGGGSKNIQFVYPLWPNNAIIRVDYSCPAGPTSIPRFIHAISADTSVNGYSHVKAFSTFTIPIFDIARDSSNLSVWMDWITQVGFSNPPKQVPTAPFDYRDSVNWSINYYARGIGLVKRENYEKKSLKSSWKLKSYHIP